MPIRVTFRPEKKLPPVIQPLNSRHHTPKVSLSAQNDLLNGSKSKKALSSSPDREGLEEVLAELDSLIGLHSVKELIYELQAFVEIQKRRTKEKLATEPLVLHMIFKGNPGTGKTTVARIIGKLIKELGVLQKGHIIECERADLVGEYIGHTAQKTKELIKKALGGILFIDEAYSLARGGEKDFGKEAIDALVKAMEDHKDNIILILAGYRHEMDWFMQTNPGLRSRFPIQIEYPHYTIDELIAIGELMLKQRQYEMTPEAKAALRNALYGYVHSHPYSGNARLVRNLIERAIRKQAVRLYQRPSSTREELMKILPDDFALNEDI